MQGEQVGSYRVVKPLGEGGMGTVWLAEHVMLGRKVALKALRPEMSQRPELVNRFFNEAKAATAIADPGIVQIFDFGFHKDGRAYIVMELLDGESLEARLRRRGTLALGAALRIARQVASSLSAAHACGIVHRDIKPENLFLVRDPEVAGGERTKILDFGIAKLSIENPVRTQTSAVMGTPMFMSPEQCRGAGQVDHRTDLYSLGCVLFTLLVGRPPFQGEGSGDILAAHLREPPPAPSSLSPHLPALVDSLVLRCLAKDRAQRFSTGAELAQAIERALADPGVAAMSCSFHISDLAAESHGAQGAADGSSSSPSLRWSLPAGDRVTVDARSPGKAQRVATTLTAASIVSLALPPTFPVHRGWLVAVLLGALGIVLVMASRGTGDDVAARTAPRAANRPAAVSPAVVPRPVSAAAAQAPTGAVASPGRDGPDLVPQPEAGNAAGNSQVAGASSAERSAPGVVAPPVKPARSAGSRRRHRATASSSPPAAERARPLVTDLDGDGIPDVR